MAPPEWRPEQGYWGPVTATIDWCEGNYEVTQYIAEFWNTVSNLGMIIPPLWGIYDALVQGFEKRFIVSYISLLVIGIGSWLFHMTLRYDMQLMDELPMVWGSSVLVYCLYQVNAPLGQKNYHIAALLFVYSVFFTIIYLMHFQDPLFQEVMYGILVCAIIILDLKLIVHDHSPFRIKLFVCGMMLYLGGFIVWNIDNFFCSSLRGLRESNMPSGLKPLTQLHGWWHILAGYATYMHILHCIFYRQRFLKEHCDYKIGVMGLVLEKQKPPKKSI